VSRRRGGPRPAPPSGAAVPPRSPTLLGVRRPTLKDVAAAAGVHPGTASRALNPLLQGRISAETTRRVRAAAGELGYVVDPIGRSLRARRSGIVGVLVPDLTNPFYPPLLRGIEDGLRAGGLEALIASTDNDIHREAELIELLKARRCDGYVLTTAVRRDPAVDALVAEGVPVVLVNRLSADHVPAVVSDDATGIAATVRHLRELGHTEIAHVTGPARFSVTVDREAAFKAALRREGVPVRRELVARAADYTAAAGEKACSRLLGDERFTAVLAGNDMIAIGCYAALERYGLRCPDDVSVAGVNDMPLAGWLRPPLTTVAVPQYELGAEAARMLFRQLGGTPDDGERRVVLPTRLVTRGSTGPAPAPVR
jgi:LacI family transcriptional regulator